MQSTYTIGTRSFVLDKAKAEAALAAKRVVGGRETLSFNLLPLRYGWAYELYRTMKANHWEPEDVQMGKDIEQWRDEKVVSDVERWIIRMGIGYFSAAEGIVGDNIQHVVRELVTAPELKLVLGRHAHEENIHADSLLYMIASLGINPHECEAMFEDVPTIVPMSSNIASHSCGSIPSEEIMYRSESAWMFSSCAWRPSTSLSSEAVTSSRTTPMTLSPTIPSAAEK